MVDSTNRYQKIISRIFFSKYHPGMKEFTFQRNEVEHAAQDLGIQLPKNIGDLLYSFRFRTPLPIDVLETAPPDECWSLELAGHGIYRFKLKHKQQIEIVPHQLLPEIKVPDATPGIVSMYALSDEQALLAKVRYNRLIDIFTGITCYSLQNHLRTTVPEHGQIETDEIYIGIDKRGAQFAIPVQAKGGRDKLSMVQIEQDVALCLHKFPSLICRPIAAQFIGNDFIALFEFEQQNSGIVLLSEKHYRLVSPEAISGDDLLLYGRHSDQP